MFIGDKYHGGQDGLATPDQAFAKNAGVIRNISVTLSLASVPFAEALRIADSFEQAGYERKLLNKAMSEKSTREEISQFDYYGKRLFPEMGLQKEHKTGTGFYPAHGLNRTGAGAAALSFTALNVKNALYAPVPAVAGFAGMDERELAFTMACCLYRRDARSGQVYRHYEARLALLQGCCGLHEGF